MLYVDEVNLLHDHLVDLLLDAAALGTATWSGTASRCGTAARFLLVGTMNPEEGELRPQLLDRFGLAVEVRASRDPGLRGEVVRRRLAYDADPAGFAERWQAAESGLAARIVGRASGCWPMSCCPMPALRQVASVCAAFDVDGLRADLVTARAALAHAAWQGRTEVTAEDVRAAARLALPHRRRRQPFDAPQLDESELDKALGRGRCGSRRRPRSRRRRAGGRAARGQPRNHAGRTPRHRGRVRAGTRFRRRRPGRGARGDGSGGAGAGPARTGVAPARPPAAPGPVFRVKRLEVPGTGTEPRAAGPGLARIPGTSPGRASRGAGPGACTCPPRLPRPRRTRSPGAATAPGRLVLRPGDLREARHEGRESNLVLFVVDASGSMAARARMGAVKGAVLSLLLDAYQRRDKVGLVTFRGSSADLALPPTFSVEAAAARLAALPTGGRTPLAAGLLRAHEVLRAERIRDPRRRPLLVLVTDGRATGGADPGRARAPGCRLLAATGVHSVVVDCESGPVRLGLAASLAQALGG